MRGGTHWACFHSRFMLVLIVRIFKVSWFTRFAVKEGISGAKT